MRIRLTEAADQLGIGGTERALENYCRYIDKSRFEITVVGFREGGVRADILRSEGFKVVIANMNIHVWEELLKGADVLHWHGDGHLDPAIFESVRRFKPKVVIQTNVFGLADRSSYYDLIDVDLYISKMCLVKRVREDGEWGINYNKKRAVLYYPVDVNGFRYNMPTSKEVEHYRKELGLGNSPVVGRIGRSDDYKFHPVAIQMMPILRRWVPDVKFLLLGPTENMRRHAIKLGIEDAFVWVEPTTDIGTLLTYYLCIDVYLAASIGGESFGMNIAEAMACSLPIVAVSTPKADNAQIELIDNGLNGLVVEAYPRLVALACKELFFDKNKRMAMGRAGVERVQSYSAKLITRSLENVIYEKLGLESFARDDFQFPIHWTSEMESDYVRRVSNLYGKPSVIDWVKASIRGSGGRLKLKLLREVTRFVRR